MVGTALFNFLNFLNQNPSLPLFYVWSELFRRIIYGEQGKDIPGITGTAQEVQG